MRTCESEVLAQTSCVILAPDGCERPASIIADRARPPKHVRRARIILHSDEGLPVQEVARRAGVSRPAVWRWQQRFAEEGVESLLRDKTRPPGKPLAEKLLRKCNVMRNCMASHTREDVKIRATELAYPVWDMRAPLEGCMVYLLACRHESRWVLDMIRPVRDLPRPAGERPLPALLRGGCKEGPETAA